MSSRFSKSDSLSPDSQTVTVGRVRKPHGVKGEVVVSVLSDIAGRFAVGECLDLVGPDRKQRSVIVASVRGGKEDAAVIRFEGFRTRDAAEEIRGLELRVARERVPPAPEGSYYFFDLIGCECEDANAGSLGKVVGILEDGGGLLLEIEGSDRTLLVPFVSAYLKNIDTGSRRVEVELPEGLVEACGLRS